MDLEIADPDDHSSYLVNLRRMFAQAAIDLVKIQAGAIPRNMVRAVSMLRFSRKIPDRPD
jgi:hypothetical protein